MFKSKFGKVKVFALFLALVLGVTIAARNAVAAPPCVPNQLEFTPSSTGGSLLIQCGGVNYEAMTSAPSGCSSRSMDTLKIWQSMGQAALLAGKNLLIYNTVCGGKTLITTLNLS